MHDKCNLIVRSDAGEFRCKGPVEKYFLYCFPSDGSRKASDLEDWTLLCRCGSHPPRSSEQLLIKEISFDEAVCHDIHSH